MTERQRALPAWMAKKEEKDKEPLKSRKKRSVARTAFYCMNEKELLEAAVSFLTDGACEGVDIACDHKVGEKTEATLKIKEKPALEEECSDCSDVLEMKYASETDLDVTEVETVPYTRSPQHQGAQGQRSGPVHGNLTNVELQAENTEEHSQVKADTAPDDDDALRLVREIFFS